MKKLKFMTMIMALSLLTTAPLNALAVTQEADSVPAVTTEATTDSQMPTETSESATTTTTSESESETESSETAESSTPAVDLTNATTETSSEITAAAPLTAVEVTPQEPARNATVSVTLNTLPGEGSESNINFLRTGDVFESYVKMQTVAGFPLPAHYKVKLSIPTESVVPGSLTVNLQNSPSGDLRQYVDGKITTEGANTIVTLEIQKLFLGEGSEITVPIIGQVAGVENHDYTINISDETPSGTPPTLTTTALPFRVRGIVDTIAPLINQYWGLSSGNNPGNFKAADSGDKSLGEYMGVYNDTAAAIPTFVQINYDFQKNGAGDFPLSPDHHYEVVFKVTKVEDDGTETVITQDEYNLAKFAMEDITDIFKRQPIPQDLYTVSYQPDGTVKVILKSPNEMKAAYGDDLAAVPRSFELKFQTIGNDSTLRYKMLPVLSVMDSQGQLVDFSTLPEQNWKWAKNPQDFLLAGKYTITGNSKVFPEILAEDKVFYVGDLTPTTFEKLMRAGAVANDTDEETAVITPRIFFKKGDKARLLQEANTPGLYPFAYRVTNKRGNTAGTTIRVTIKELAQVIVKYRDEADHEIHPDQTYPGSPNEKYDTTTPQYKLTIPGYVLDESKLPANATGEFTSQPQTVIYYYKKIPEPVQKATITVKYVDEAGQTLHDDQLIEGLVGDKYDATTADYKLVIEGYSLVESKLPENATGAFTKDPITVIYVYKKTPVPVKKAAVTVKYVNEAGQTLHDDQLIEGLVGDKYDATTADYKLVIEGYSLVESKLPKNATGAFTKDPITVVYVYKKTPEPVKKAAVTVKYVDEAGQTLHDDQLIEGLVGDKYDATTADYKLVIEGYSLVESKLPQNATGAFTKDPITVIYVYKKTPEPVQKAAVTVKYVDEAGQTLHDDQLIEGLVGDKYDATTADYKLVIDGYSLVESKLPENATGAFTKDPITVVYVYKKILPTPIPPTPVPPTPTPVPPLPIPPKTNGGGDNPIPPVTGNKKTPTVTVTPKKTATIPNTGATDQPLIALFGLGLLAVLGWLMYYRRKSHD